MNIVSKLITLYILLYSMPACAGTVTIQPEKYYRDNWCREHNGQIEYLLPDKTRCDCLTNSHAIEFDFGNKWAEAIGQALYYSIQTGKRPGVVLILKNQAAYRYYIRLNTIIQHFKLPIEVFLVKLY